MTTSIDMGHLATIHHQRAIRQLVCGLEKRDQPHADSFSELLGFSLSDLLPNGVPHS